MLQTVATGAGNTRMFGSKGHNQTVTYIKGKLDATGYYDIELQTFPFTILNGTAKFSTTGIEKDYEAEYLTYAPSGDVSAELMVAKEVGCNGVTFPPPPPSVRVELM